MRVISANVCPRAVWSSGMKPKKNGWFLRSLTLMSESKVSMELVKPVVNADIPIDMKAPFVACDGLSSKT